MNFNYRVTSIGWAARIVKRLRLSDFKPQPWNPTETSRATATDKLDLFIIFISLNLFRDRLPQREAPLQGFAVGDVLDL